uniref:Ig-like domain-containing protein n=1 Tax=Salvator merianae TaxID=96440 RepID=A0A8D0BPJ1_SALMN
MQNSQGGSRLGRGTEEAGGTGRGLGRAPPSPAIPPKRAKVTTEQGGPAAPVFLQELKDTAVSIGHTLVLKAVVTGGPQPHLSWYKDKVPVARTKEEEEEEEYGSLRIYNSKPADAGVYRCVAKNKHGEVVSSATVTITDMEDSETGEDDASSTQVTQRSQQDETTYSSPTGESDTLVDASMKTTPTSVPGLSQTDEHSSWSGSQTTVLEKDPEGGPTVRGPYLHPSIPSSLPHGGFRRDDANSSSKVSTDTLHPPAQKPPLQRPVSPRAAQCPVQPPGASRGPTPPVAPRRKLLMPPEFQDTAAEEFDEKLKRPKSSVYSQAGTGDSRPQTPLSEASSRVSVLRPSPKLPRSGSKIFDKYKFFEERRKSLEQNENPFAGHRWLPLRKTRSFDQPGLDDASPFLSAVSHEDLQEDTRSELGGAAFRRYAFHQKAASLDERGRYSSRLYDLEHKFTEELGRIKRTVSQQQLRRSQELFRSPSPRTSTEPPGPKVPPPRKLKPLKALPLTENAHGVQQLVLSSVGLVGPRDDPKGPQKPLLRSSTTADQTGAQKEIELNGQQDLQRKVEQCQLTRAVPLPRRDLLQTAPTEGNACTDGGSANTGKGSQESKGPSEVLHARKREPGQEGHSLPRTKTEAGTDRSRAGTYGASKESERKSGKVTEKKDNALQPQEGKAARSRGKGRRTRRTSPEPESSDDSYISAGEDPLEAPIFEIPIQDVTVIAGTEALFKCIITGNPSPEVSWRKDGIPFRSSTAHPIKAEGERHTLLVRNVRVVDAGLYTVCATNEVGEACCSAILTVRPAPPEAHSRLVPRHELSSPVTSDEEYLSPLEEFPESSTPRHHPAMKVQPRSEIGSAPAHLGINFKAAPSFEVALSDQAVLEGQDVVLRIRVKGEPKPIVHWLKNRHPIKYGRRISAIEEEDGSFCLHIRMVECSDAGYYACKAINEYGTKQCEAKLDVQGGVS